MHNSLHFRAERRGVRIQHVDRFLSVQIAFEV